MSKRQKKYVSARKIDQYTTGTPNATQPAYADYLDTLVGIDNPITNPDYVIDAGQIILPAVVPSAAHAVELVENVEPMLLPGPHSIGDMDGMFARRAPAHPRNLSNPLRKRTNRASSPRDKMYNSLSGFMQSFSASSSLLG